MQTTTLARFLSLLWITASLSACTRYAGVESLLALLFPFSGGAAFEIENNIVLHQSGGSTAVIEGSANDDIAYSLAAAPAGVITLTVSTDSSRILLNGAPTATLAFDNECPSARCYLNPQTIAVSAVDNAQIDGDATVEIAAAAHGAASAVATGPRVTAQVYDNDGPPTVALTATSAAVSEGGSTASIAVRLTRDPGAAVTIEAAFDADQLRINGTSSSPVSLVFDSSNWNTPRTLTIAATDDALDEGVHTTAINISSPDLSDTKSIGVAINDNDVKGATLTVPVGGVSTTEGGASGSYSIRLNSEPSSAVAVTLSFSPQIQINGANAPVVFTFTPANWNTAQTAAVAAVDDDALEGAHSATISHAFSGGDYAGVSVADLSAAITDNDSAGIALSESGGGTAAGEDGSVDAYTLRLASAPAGAVTISVAFDPAQVRLNGPSGPSGAVSPYAFTIAAADWNTASTVSVSAVNDSDVEGAHTTSLIHTASGGGYNAAPAVTLTAALTDNDSAGLIISQSDGSTDVTEASGSADAYTIKLAAPPTGDVTVSIAFDGAQVSVNGSVASPRSLVFTSANWNTAQTVSVQALGDALVEGGHVITLEHTLTSAGDPAFHAIGHATDADVQVNVTDNVKNAWWDSAYGYRRKITFNCAHDAYTVDHTASVALDTSDAARFEASGADLRVTWQPSAGALRELDRTLQNWGTATRVDFRLQSSLPANACPEDSDGSYYIYYKNAAAGAAPGDETVVYYFADYFNRVDSSDPGLTWLEWLQNTTGLAADTLLDGGRLAIRGGAYNVFSGTAHILETGAARQISATPMTANFRAEFDWFVPEHRDKYSAPSAVGWARDNDWHVGFSLGDFASSDHRALYGGKTGEVDQWIAVNLLLGEGEGATPDPNLDPTDHGCPGSSNPDCEYFALQPRLNNHANPNFERINNAPGFSHNPWNWDPVMGEDAWLRLRLDVRPTERKYDVWLNQTLHMNGVEFIAPALAPITHVRFFESHYADLLSSTGFDATPPHRFDNLRIFYPADGVAGVEEAPP